LQIEGKPVLEKDHILAIGEFVRNIADRMGIPVDVEWALDKTGLFLLQARPVTNLIGKHIYSNKLVSDMIPGLIKPLLWSSNVRSMSVNVFGRIFTRLIGPNTYDFSHLVRRICSRVYTDMTLLGELLEKAGLPSNFMGMIAREEKSRRLPSFFSARLVFKSVRSLPFVFKFAFARKEMRRFIISHNSKLARLRESDWSDCTEQELLEKIQYMMKIHGFTQWYVVVAGINMMIRNKLLTRFITVNVPQMASQQLLKGLIGLKSLEPSQRIRAMAAKARYLAPETLAILESGDHEAIQRVLKGTSEGAELLEDMYQLIEKYGFLSSSGTDFSATPWCEDHTFVWKSVVRAASGPTELSDRTAESERLQSFATVIDCLGPFKRFRFRRIFSRTIEYIDMRERISMLMSQDAYQMRRLFQALAEKFLDRGFLRDKDDIFYLYLDEIEELIHGKIGISEVQSRITKRMKEMEADARIEPSGTICGDNVTYKTVAELREQNFLVGICGSPGIVTGKARIILDPAHAPEKFEENDILVVPFTDAGWIPLFTVVSGVVAETGGILSHTSIVAREYGLPAIVNVKDATAIIRDNQTITLDANEGKVYLK
jgi:pyruvate,water dikinase